MDNLPLDLENLILNYKYQLEHVSKMNKILKDIKKFRFANYELSTERQQIRYVGYTDKLMIYYFGFDNGKYYTTSDVM